MPRMMHLEHGFHTCTDPEVEDLLRQGWVIFTDEDMKRALAAKNQSVTMEAPTPKRMGRPKRVEAPAPEVSDGNSTDNY